MDLSGLIFVVLAVAWAGYLIPKALRRHEDNALNAPIDSFSDTMRVLDRTPATMKALLAKKGNDSAAATATIDASEERRSVKPKKPRATKKKAGAAKKVRTAAQRRRRVLGLLVALTVVTGAVSGFAVIPPWSAAIPAGLIVGWLVLCRLMVRSQTAVRVRTVRDVRPAEVAASAPAEQLAQDQLAPEQLAPELVAVADSQSGPVVRGASGIVEELSDDAEDSLWDPLPLTLPTYVTKPAARRTVRSIDLTQPDVTSSGHDAADSQVAREAEAATQQDAAQAATETAERRVAGA